MLGIENQTYLLNHVLECFLLVLLELLVVLHAGHVQLVLSLRLGRLKRAGQDGDIDVLNIKDYRS